MTKIYYGVRLLVFTTIAILIGVFSHPLLEYLHFLVGGVMLIYGVEGILFASYRARKKVLQEYQFYLGTMELLFGLVMTIAIRDFNNICIIWATWTIVRESFELYETSHKFFHRFPAILSLVLSGIEIVFSVMLLLFASEHHALTHIYLLVPEFIINGLSPFLFELFKSRHHQE